MIMGRRPFFMSPLLAAKMYCLAIIRNPEGMKGCRNYATFVKDDDGNETRSTTCNIHKDYFNSSYNENLSKCSAFLHYQNSGVRKRMEECISLRIISPSKKRIEILKEHDGLYDRYAYYIMLCAKYGSIQPSWNRPFWKKIVRQLWFWHGTYAIGPVSIAWTDMIPMLCVKGDVGALYSGLLAFPLERWEHVSENYNWIYFLEICVDENPVWFLEFWMTDAHVHAAALDSAPREDQAHPIMEFLRGEKFASWLSYKKREFYLRRIPSDLKDQITAVANHPERHRDWVLGCEEKKEVEAAWGLGPEQGEPLRTVLEEVCGC